LVVIGQLADQLAGARGNLNRMPTPLPPDRAATLRALAASEFDILVIGGGITGCGIARDAALRGLRVALVERDDFASGTSSRSSRLVHGGVRYLEHGQLHLVFEASAERRRLLKLAPHLVRPLAFTWPVYAGARIQKWKLSAGLTLYDLLALFRNVAPHHRLTPAQVELVEPALTTRHLDGGAKYYDAHTSDARLTIVNAVGAAASGAVICNHAPAVRLIVENGRVRGATVRDAIGGCGASITVRARCVVNACGPWSDEWRPDGRAPSAVRGSKGVHIAVPRSRVANQGALTLIVPQDGRVFFVLPSGEQTIIGTTDTYTDESPDAVRASPADVAYLLSAANAYFPAARLADADVIAAWAGIRPLLPASGSTPGAATREHAISVDPRGLLTITGGKLTTYRIMARQVVDRAIALGSMPAGKPRTGTVPLPGGDMRSFDSTVALAAREIGDAAYAEHLVGAYGSGWRAVWNVVTSDGPSGQVVAPGLLYRMGEMRFGVLSEFAVRLGDLLIRRSPVAFQLRDQGRSLAPRIAAYLAQDLGWSPAAEAAAVEHYEGEVSRIFGPARSSGRSTCSADPVLRPLDRQSPRIAMSGSTAAARRAGR
jgi:glycerol-3-phosphate dehydrogenase